jgi:hypothetical protein
MGLINAKPLVLRPGSLTDAIDGTNAPKGSFSVLQNLIPNPSTAAQFVCRPASIEIATFSGVLSPILDNFGNPILDNFGNPIEGQTGSFDAPTAIEAILVIGTRVYGMVATNLFPGHSQPFCYDIPSQNFIAISNVTMANTPASIDAFGGWTPPVVAMINNGRIIITHPGYDGASHLLGWLDISNFALSSLLGNITAGSKVIASIQDGGTSAPSLDGVQVGYLVTAPGIPANTYVAGITNGDFDLETTATTNSTTTLSSVANVTGLQIGMNVAGVGIAPGTYIEALPGGGNVTLSQAATASAAGVAITFSGGGTITLTNAATANTSLLALDITGGSAAAPLYGAGNTSPNELTSIPTCVAQFNGRAYYGVGNALVWSDSLNPTQITNGDQAIFLGDSTPITALAGLPLTSQVTGGIIQSLTAFKGVETYYQVTGDAALSNLTVAAVDASVGTEAPNTLCGTPEGLAYIAPDGLRFLTYAGTCTPPVGADGEGVSIPFINAVNPSRMSMAYNGNTLRVSVQNGAVNGQPYQEYWLNLKRKVWTGPHTFPSALISAYPAETSGGAFICAPSPGVTVSVGLWESWAIPNAASVYVENGADLQCVWQPTLFPDNEEMAMNAMIETAIGLSLPPMGAVTILALDEAGDQLNLLSLRGDGAGSAVWGSFKWGAATWGASVVPYQQYRLSWTEPLVFKQGTIRMSFTALSGYVIGNLYMKYQRLGYLIGASVA